MLSQGEVTEFTKEQGYQQSFTYGKDKDKNDIKFGGVPEVIVWLTGAKVNCPKTPKIKLEVIEVKDTGFTVRACSTSEATITSASFSWFAHWGSMGKIKTGSFSTTQIHAEANPKKITTERIVWADPFGREPTLLVGLNFVECSQYNDLRASVSLAKVAKNGFTWYFSTWGHTDLRAAGGSYIAFEA